ncbi:hypothetical protein SAMN04488076_1131, partial [Trichococcus palustris]
TFCSLASFRSSLRKDRGFLVDGFIGKDGKILQADIDAANGTGFPLFRFYSFFKSFLYLSQECLHTAILFKKITSKTCSSPQKVSTLLFMICMCVTFITAVFYRISCITESITTNAIRMISIIHIGLDILVSFQKMNLLHKQTPFSCVSQNSKSNGVDFYEYIKIIYGFPKSEYLSKRLLFDRYLHLQKTSRRRVVKK